MGLKSARLIKEALADVAGDDPHYVILEKSSERRVTTGVMYVPDMVDAHGEYATADDLEEAVHGYMERGDLRVRKQHGAQIIGRVVGMIAWPFEQEVQLSPATSMEKAKAVKLPAGTVYATVKWTPEAWPLVKQGKIRGYSMGGAAVRVHG